MEQDGNVRLTAEKYAPLAFLMGLALLVGLSVISYRSLSDLTQTADEVTNTHLVMNKLEEVLSDFKDVVSGYRGYVLTGKDSYLDGYYEGRRNVDLEFQELRYLTADNSRQKLKLEEIEHLKQRILRLSEEIVETRRTRGFDAALAMLRGRPLMVEIRQRITEMEREENHLLRLRESAAHSSARYTKMVLAAGSLVGVLLTTLAILAVRGELGRRKRAEDALRQSNVELERRARADPANDEAAVRIGRVGHERAGGSKALRLGTDLILDGEVRHGRSIGVEENELLIAAGVEHEIPELNGGRSDLDQLALARRSSVFVEAHPVPPRRKTFRAVAPFLIGLGDPG